MSELIRYELCRINDLSNGQMREFEIRTSSVNSTVLLIKQNNRFYAYGSKCCHYKLPLVKGVLSGNHLRCFAHGACFRVDTGDIEDHPGHGHLPKYEIEIVGEQIILIAEKSELEKLERINIPNELDIQPKPVVAIIGAGAAGFTCADMLRQNGFHGRIVMFSREGVLPYDRVQLSKQPTKKLENLLLRDTSYFKKAKIELLLNTTVTNVYCPSQNIAYRTIGDQLRSLQYDYLVLATGLTSRKLPSSLSGSNLRNIFYLRSLEDADRLVNQVKSSNIKDIAIIGDSFIALELCGWLTTGLEEKKNVSVLMRSNIPMKRIFGERIGRALQSVHEKNGAKFYANVNVTELTGENDAVKFVHLSTGQSIASDLVLVAIGSELCTDLYRNTPIEMTADGFIEVNQRLQTSVDKVLAIGDICKYSLNIFDLPNVNCQHWQMACSQGHQAANTILNNWKALDFYSVPFYWSTQNNKTTIRYAGYTRQPDDVIIHGDLENDELKFVAYYLVDDKVQAVAQSKYDPLTSEIAEIFYQKKTIRKNDIENDLFGYKKYL